jgi:hypothetical protein
MEEFKSLDEVTTVDRRNTYFVLHNRATGETRSQELKDHYESVGTFVLSETVPEEVRSHFNTAKNVLLYTWYVYGFFPVAELQALNALELALKERIGEGGLKVLKKQLKKTGKRPGLQAYIEHAAASKWIKNEDFEAYHRAPYERARQKLLLKKSEEMREKGLSSIKYDEEEIEVPDTNTTDYIGILLDTVNYIRNVHAHGETMLYPASVWQTFEVCADFINALYRGATVIGDSAE